MSDERLPSSGERTGKVLLWRGGGPESAAARREAALVGEPDRSLREEGEEAIARPGTAPGQQHNTFASSAWWWVPVAAIGVTILLVAIGTGAYLVWRGWQGTRALVGVASARLDMKTFVPSPPRVVAPAPLDTGVPAARAVAPVVPALPAIKTVAPAARPRPRRPRPSVPELEIKTSR